VALIVLHNGPTASGTSTVAERHFDRWCDYVDTTVHAVEQVRANAVGTVR